MGATWGPPGSCRPRGALVVTAATAVHTHRCLLNSSRSSDAYGNQQIMACRLFGTKPVYKMSLFLTGLLWRMFHGSLIRIQWFSLKIINLKISPATRLFSASVCYLYPRVLLCILGFITISRRWHYLYASKSWRLKLNWNMIPSPLMAIEQNKDASTAVPILLIWLNRE